MHSLNDLALITAYKSTNLWPTKRQYAPIHYADMLRVKNHDKHVFYSQMKHS